MHDPDRLDDEEELSMMEAQDQMPDSFARVESMNHAMRTAQIGEPASDIINRAAMYYQFLKTGQVPVSGWGMGVRQ